MRRRRKAKATWFPIFGNSYIAEAPLVTPWESFAYAFGSGQDEGSFATDGSGAAVLVDPLLQDEDSDEDSTSESLRDRVEGKDYVVNRIVGKVWGSLEQRQPETQQDSEILTVIMCAAIGVFPVGPDGSIMLTESEYNPLLARNSAQPWAWRRTWVLYNNLVGVNIFTGPTNIGSYGSVMDGGHLDMKVSRRVRKEERLFFVASTMMLNSIGHLPIESQTSLIVGHDLRILGGMRRATNKSVIS